MNNKLKWIVVGASFAVMGLAQAGPRVTVVVKNNSDNEAVYSPMNQQEMLTRSFIRSAPLDTLRPRQSDQYEVEGRLSSDVTTAFLRYKIGSKTCTFMSTYVMSVDKGRPAPKWNKGATSPDGARCEARIIKANPSSHEWTVEFSMR